MKMAYYRAGKTQDSLKLVNKMTKLYSGIPGSRDGVEQEFQI